MKISIKPWHKHWRGVIAIIFLAIILFFLATSAFYFIGEIKNARLKSNKTDQPPGGQTYKAAGDNNNYWLGSANAKITIVEFGDFTCTHSKSAFPTIRELSLKYKNDIKFIWRDYPVVSDYSLNLALAGRCAGEQNFFWPMHDKLFQNQGVGQTNDKVAQVGELAALANQIGADPTRFNDCMNKQKYLPQIQKDLTDGQTFGIVGSDAGTPTYFINGYKIPGDIPYDTFVKIIEELKK